MTSESGLKLRTLWIVVVLVFAVTATGGYVTTAVLTDNETVGLSFHVVGNAGNAGNTDSGETAVENGSTGNASLSAPAAFSDPAAMDGSTSPEHGRLLAQAPELVKAPSAKPGFGG